VKLSVILITHNTREMTAANARKAAASLAGGDELIVVDNGSSDGTVAALGAQVPSARVLPAGRNLGFARAANLGARSAVGEVLLFLNSDAELTPVALKGLKACFMVHPRCGAVGAFLVNPDGSPQRSADGVPLLAGELLGKTPLRLLMPGRFPTVKQGTAPVEVPTLVGACMAVSREAFDAVEGFDERFFFFLEETDLCLRLRQGGWGVLVAPSARVIHGQGLTARKVRPQARVEYDLSRYRFFRKHHGMAAVAILYLGILPRILGGCLINGVGMVATLGLYARWRDKAASQGYRLAWHLLLCPPGWGLDAGATGSPAPVSAAVAS